MDLAARLEGEGVFAWPLRLALAAVTLAGCGSSHDPPSAVTDLSLVVHSAEWEAERSLALVGEDVSAEITTATSENCLSDAPCPLAAEVELRSSDPGVLMPLQQRVRTPATVALVANRPGTSTLTVTVEGKTQSTRVDVVSDPLPLDAVRVALITTFSDLPAQYDLSNSLTSVEVQAGEYGALEIVPLRAGTEVFGLPIAVTSDPYTVAKATTGCRPVRIDPGCLHVGDAWLWGETAGDALVTVSVRNISTGFTAHVP
jgi:hypothetical protein